MADQLFNENFRDRFKRLKETESAKDRLIEVRGRVYLPGLYLAPPQRCLSPGRLSLADRRHVVMHTTGALGQARFTRGGIPHGVSRPQSRDAV